MKPSEVPNPRSTSNLDVQDLAQVLGPEYLSLIDGIAQKLEKYADSQIAIVTIDHLNDLAIEEYSLQLATRFGIGKKGEDSGVLILFARDNRKVRIEVGYGLESILTDAKTKQFIQNDAIPFFKEKQYGRGLYNLTKAVALEIAKAKTVNLDIEDPQNFPQQIEASNITKPETLSREEPNTEKKTLEASPPNPLKPFLFLSISFTLFWTLFTFYKLKKKRGKKEKLDFLKEFYDMSYGFVIVVGFLVGAIYAFLTEALFETIKAYAISAASSWGLSFLFQLGFKKSISSHQLNCKKCGKTMSLLPEKQIEKLLSEKEKVEQQAEAMSYEFWHCDSCNTNEKISSELSSAALKRCPRCQWYSLSFSTKDIDLDEYLNVTKCLNPHCQYRNEVRYTRSSSTSSSSATYSSYSSSSSSSSSSRSYGGGSFGGGGSSGSW